MYCFRHAPQVYERVSARLHRKRQYAKHKRGGVQRWIRLFTVFFRRCGKLLRSPEFFLKKAEKRAVCGIKHRFNRIFRGGKLFSLQRAPFTRYKAAIFCGKIKIKCAQTEIIQRDNLQVRIILLLQNDLAHVAVGKRDKRQRGQRQKRA